MRAVVAVLFVTYWNGISIVAHGWQRIVMVIVVGKANIEWKSGAFLWGSVEVIC